MNFCHAVSCSEYCYTYDWCGCRPPGDYFDSLCGDDNYCGPCEACSCSTQTFNTAVSPATGACNERVTDHAITYLSEGTMTWACSYQCGTCGGCNSAPPCTTPVNGGWGEWSPQGECGTYEPCLQKYVRECNNPAPSCGGAECTGSSITWEACGTSAVWTDLGTCSATCGGGNTLRRCDATCGALCDGIYSNGATAYNGESCNTCSCIGTSCTQSSSCCSGICSVSCCFEACSADDWYCNGNTEEYRDYYCNGAGDCTYSASQQSDCSMKASTDSDNGATYQSGGTVTDYTVCSGSSCTGNTYSDYCSGTSVYEYWASGSSYTGGLYSCENYESYFCSGNDRYHKEWGCSGSPGYCDDTAAADSYVESCSAYNGCSGDDFNAYSCIAGSCTYTADSCTDCSCSCGGYNAVETNANLNCEDGKDNDCDGLTDYTDPECCKPDGLACTQGSQCCSANCVIEGVGNDICCGAGNTCVDFGNVCRVKAIENTLALCTDNIDNDCNGFADSSDTSCYGTVSGTAKNTQGNPLNNAKVEVYRSGAKVGEGYTLADGSYSIAVPAGTFSLAAIFSDYISGSADGIVVPALGNVLADFNLTYGKVCEDDCTYLLDDACHASCNGQNGCSFYDQAAANACDLAKAGWSVSYDMAKVISCCEGQPEDKSEVKAYVNCGLPNLVKHYTIVNYNGKHIKMVTVVCDE